jgi:acyl dehydratase
MSLTTRFKAPVRIGDTVTATCTVREVVATSAACCSIASARWAM